MQTFLLYGHGGCENHGCEAIIRGTADILHRQFPDTTLVLSKQDGSLGIDGQLDLPVERILLQNPLKKHSLKFVWAGTQYALFKSKTSYYNFLYKDLRTYLKYHPVSVAFSIGGDNYCYGMHNSLYYLDKLLKPKCKRVLWGCSVDPASLNDAALIADLDSLDLIVGREPLTVRALKKVLKKARVEMRPDPAFALKANKTPLPASLIGKTVVGVNVSPTVGHMVDGVNMTFVNYDKMIEHILQTTDYGVLLIPHVTWEKNNDFRPLTELYQKYKESGRVELIREFSDCEQLKGYIAQCDMFIGARTHSTIAAYSSCVPCVVVGYSVKADGIATQLFGTTENYVVDSRQLQREDTLIGAFDWLNANHREIRAHLEKIMPAYIEEAFSAAQLIRDLL